jgi:MFS transporter, DHA1 family, inner membrane transport protein
MPVALLSLTVAAFGIGVSEFAVMGLLPGIAASLHVTVPAAGWLVTCYAAGVIAGAPLLTAAAGRLPRRTMLEAIIGVLAAASALSALAPSFPVLAVARFLAGIPQGALFGAGAVVAAELAGPSRRARGMPIMFAGFTASLVAGVPLETLAGQHCGWRVAFWLICGVAALSLAAVAAFVPPCLTAPPSTLRAELGVLRRPQVWLAFAVTTAGFAGVFASFTYVTPAMTQLARFSGSSLTYLIALFGLGMAAGNALSARFSGRALMRGIQVFLAGLAGSLLAGAAGASSKPAAALSLFLTGLFGFATVPALQMRILDKAGGAATLAATLNMSAFNVANALGALAAGITIAHGLGYRWPDITGAGLTLIGLALATMSARLDASRASAPRTRPEAAGRDHGGAVRR